jgi:hypothetical protein
MVARPISQTQRQQALDELHIRFQPCRSRQSWRIRIIGIAVTLISICYCVLSVQVRLVEGLAISPNEFRLPPNEPGDRVFKLS